jgi:CheB methylesterase
VLTSNADGVAKDFPVVCVGGSAGGLDAYTRLLRHLPADMGVAIVIVNHLRTVVVRYRMHLESRKLAPGTVNLRLGAVRRLAYEATDCGLLSPDLAAGIRRVKGVKKLGVRLGNWLPSLGAVVRPRNTR